MSLVWRPEMAIDNGIIDHDHQVLISITSDFIELKPRVGSTVELQRTMARLYHYANTHFAREEALQRAVGFPSSAEHARQHKILNERIDNIAQRLIELDQQPVTLASTPASGDVVVVENAQIERVIEVHAELSRLLRTWILGHILKTDLPMRLYVASMRKHAVDMPSLWTAKPALLAPQIDTPKAARQTLANPHGWMSARFREDAQLASQATEPAHVEHPVIARMNRDAQALGMKAVFDPLCVKFDSPLLRQAFDLVSRIRPGTTGPNGFALLPSDARPYSRHTALFLRTANANGQYTYRATYVGANFARIFGNIVNQSLETAKAPHKFARWKMLIDGTLELNAPLHVVSIAEAFGRDDLAVEGLIVPFRSADRQHDVVMVITSYDIGFD